MMRRALIFGLVVLMVLCLALPVEAQMVFNTSKPGVIISHGGIVKNFNATNGSLYIEHHSPPVSLDLPVYIMGIHNIETDTMKYFKIAGFCTGVDIGIPKNGTYIVYYKIIGVDTISGALTEGPWREAGRIKVRIVENPNLNLKLIQIPKSIIRKGEDVIISWDMVSLSPNTGRIIIALEHKNPPTDTFPSISHPFIPDRIIISKDLSKEEVQMGTHLLNVGEGLREINSVYFRNLDEGDWRITIRAISEEALEEANTSEIVKVDFKVIGTPPPIAVVTPTPTASPTPSPTGFETVFAIAGLLVIAYLLKRRE